MQASSYRHVFRITLTVLWITIQANALWSQAYPLGINPPTLQWRQIDTDKVQVVFPSTVEDQAQRVANLVHTLYDSGYYSLGPRRQKVSIILQNQNTTSNGFVTVSPFRSEFYLTPPQYSFLGSLDWLDGLTIHEYRHVEQFVNAKKNITRLGYLLFGQNGWGVTAGLALPRWFFEGDAVFYETALSQGGRGRMPDFENEVKAMLLSRKKIPGYELASATSYKQFIPNHYNLGFYLTTSMREKYGHETLGSVVDYAVSYRSVIFPFSFGLKKFTGSRTPQFYRSTMTSLKDQWSSDVSNQKIRIDSLVNIDKKKTVTNYRLPIPINDTTIISMKSGYRDINQIVSIDRKTGEEKRLLETGFIGSPNITLSTNGKYVVWAELSFSPRYELLDYSNIRIYDLEQDESRLITQDSRLFAPAISQNGDVIAAIQIGKDMREQLQIINVADGTVIDSIAIDSGYRISFPFWKNEFEIGFVLTKGNLNALACYDRTSKSIKPISPFWEGLISYPTYHGNNYYFSAIFDGTDNIYQWSVDQQSLTQTTYARFGAQQPSISSDGMTLFYADYSWQGYDIKSAALNAHYQENVQLTSSPSDYISPLLDYNVNLDKITEKKFPTKELKETQGLLNIHSWTPWFLPPNFGIILEADNIMSTFSAEGSISYNTNEMASTYGVHAEYARFFPALHIDLSRSERSRYVPFVKQDTIDNQLTVFYTTSTLTWVENDFSAGFTLPFNTTFKNYFSKIWITNQFHIKTVDYPNGSLGLDDQFGAYTLDISAYILKRMARQHLFPRVGISWDMSYRTTTQSTDHKGTYFQNQVRTYLPGLFKTHHIRLDVGMQKESFLSTYKFMDDFFYARGYGAPPHDQVAKFGFNYALPLLYPDIPIGPFLFIQRMKANFFFDRMTTMIDPHVVKDFLIPETIDSRYLNATFSSRESTYRSYGLETTFDIRLFRSLDANLGFRVSYLMDPPAGGSNLVSNFILLNIGI